MILLCENSTDKSQKKQTDLFSVSSDLHCNDHDVLYHVQPFHEFCTE